MSGTEDCICNRRNSKSKPMEYFKINGSRIELRCGKCNGLVTWWDERSCSKKILPVNRAWSDEECQSMR
jgi:hypothetical protein